MTPDLFGSATGGAQPLPPNFSEQTLQRGQLYKLPNGQAGRWDGKQFVGE